MDAHAFYFLLTLVELYHYHLAYDVWDWIWKYFSYFLILGLCLILGVLLEFAWFFFHCIHNNDWILN